MGQPSRRPRRGARASGSLGRPWLALSSARWSAPSAASPLLSPWPHADLAPDRRVHGRSGGRPSSCGDGGRRGLARLHGGKAPPFPQPFPPAFHRPFTALFAALSPSSHRPFCRPFHRPFRRPFHCPLAALLAALFAALFAALRTARLLLASQVFCELAMMTGHDLLLDALAFVHQLTVPKRWHAGRPDKGCIISLAPLKRSRAGLHPPARGTSNSRHQLPLPSRLFSLPSAASACLLAAFRRRPWHSRWQHSPPDSASQLRGRLPQQAGAALSGAPLKAVVIRSQVRHEHVQQVWTTAVPADAADAAAADAADGPQSQMRAKGRLNRLGARANGP